MFKGLRWRLLAYYLIVIITIIVLMGSLFIWYVHQFYRQSVEDSLANQARLTSALVAELLNRSASNREIDQSIKELGADLGVRITLIRADGTVIADSAEEPGAMDNHATRPEILAAEESRSGVAVRYSRTIGEEMLYLALPFQYDEDPRNSDQPISFVRMALPLTAINRTFFNLRLSITVALVVASLLAFSVSILLANRITRPIRRISDASKAIAAGDFLPALDVAGQDEVADLAVNIKAMGAALQQIIDQLTAEKNKIAAVVTSMRSGIILIDRNFSIELINPAAERLFDLESMETIGTPLQNAIRYYALHENIKAAVRDGEPRFLELNLYYPRTAVIDAAILPVKGTAAEVIGLLLVFQEVTKLRSIEKMRSDFVANVSHELRTPLTTLRGYTETIIYEDLSDDQRKEFLIIIDREADRLARLVDDLLDLARIENEKGLLRTSNLDLKKLVDSALDEVKTLGDAKQMKFSLLCDDQPLPVRGNQEWLRQALVNILENSIRYGNKSGQIEIRLSAAAGQAQVKISDDGPGIPETDLPYIFERFYRVDKGRSKKSGGTGLGLAIVKHIMEAHGATYSLENNPDGRGLSFSFSLPL